LSDANGHGDGALDAPLGLSDGLVAYYPMETTGTMLVDATANHLDGMCFGATSCSIPTAGIIGGANQFIGGTTYHVPDSSALHLSVFTVSVWVNKGPASSAFAKTQLAGAGASFELPLFDNDTWFCTDSDPGTLGENCIMTGMPLPAAWTHIALTFDGTTNRIYRDGVEIGSMAAPPPAYDASPFVVGGDREDGVDKGFFGNGSLDELRIYDRALSPADIVTLRDLR
jgi:hypothetical protein